MSSISSISQIVALLRREMAAPAQAAPGKPRGAAAAAAAGRPGRGDVLALTARRVEAIAADDPERGRKAFRAFLEAVLLNEFGDTLINDPAFYAMVEQIQRRMEADPATAQAIDAAVRQLLARAPAAGNDT